MSKLTHNVFLVVVVNQFSSATKTTNPITLLLDMQLAHDARTFSVAALVVATSRWSLAASRLIPANVRALSDGRSRPAASVRAAAARN